MIPEIGTGRMQVGTTKGIDAVAGEERTGVPNGMRQLALESMALIITLDFSHVVHHLNSYL